jgi:hypothetical protein
LYALDSGVRVESGVLFLDSGEVNESGDVFDLDSGEVNESGDVFDLDSGEVRESLESDERVDLDGEVRESLESDSGEVRESSIGVFKTVGAVEETVR